MVKKITMTVTMIYDIWDVFYKKGASLKYRKIGDQDEFFILLTFNDLLVQIDL